MLKNRKEYLILMRYIVVTAIWLLASVETIYDVPYLACMPFNFACLNYMTTDFGFCSSQKR